MKTLVLDVNEKSIELAKEILTNHGVIGMPTETVYGLAGNGLDSEAVKEIYSVKGRPSDNPLIAHVHKNYDISKLVKIEKDYVYKLMDKFMPGPLTLVFNSLNIICKEAVCGGETLAIRMPSHKGCQKLLEFVNLPLVAPSANISKHTSPVTAQHVLNDLNGKIPLILDGGKCSGGIESTVLDVTSDIPRILRPGLITKEMIIDVVGGCEIAQHKEGDRVKSPGVKYRHYRPKCDTALFFEEDGTSEIIKKYDQEVESGRIPFIMCSNDFAKKLGNRNFLLLGGSETEIASNLYDKLLEGESKADIIIAVGVKKEGGVFLGIMNRLRKSCG